MAAKDFMGPLLPGGLTAPRRGGTITELRNNAYVAKGEETLKDVGAGIGYKPDALRGSRDVVPINVHTHDIPKNPVSSTEEYSLEFLANVLDQYDVYTYHWKLFITPLSAARSGKILDSSVQTIIVESGVTDLTIDNVEIDAICVPSVEAGTGTQTLVKFDITEPSGAGLLDKMYYQSLSLGIGNWLVMPTFLQLEFRGRDPVTGDSAVSGGSGALADLRWIWPLKLTNTKANVTEVGTRYNFEAVIYDELAQSNSYFSIQHNIVLNNLTDFQSAIKELELKINQDQDYKLIDNYDVADVYRFVIDPNIALKEFNISDGNKSTARASSTINLKEKTASFNAGTGIDKIIDMLLGNTSYFQKKLQSSKTSISEPETANDMVDQMKQFWRIVTETKPIEFDHLRQDNAVEITIFIMEYDLGALSTTPSQVGGDAESLPAARKRLAEYSAKKILKKKYNYIFTGLNDQIINLNLNMNFAFAAALSRFGGVYYDTAGQDKGISQQEFAKQEQYATYEARMALQFIHNSNDATDIDRVIKTAVTNISTSTSQQSRLDNITKVLEKAKAARSGTFYANRIDRLGSVNLDNVVTSPAASQATAAAVSLAAPTSNGLSFISDVDIYSPAAKEAAKTAAATLKGKLRPIPFREGVFENNLGVGMDPASDAGRARTASMFSTALYSTLDASLQTIKLTIKGDPYWLFPRNVPLGEQALNYRSNMADDAAIRSIKKAHIDYPNSVNLFGTDNFIVIRFRTPRIANDDTGMIDPFVEVETFSGVYKVITLVNKFVNGKFTQELNCILDPMINLSDFLRDIENASKQPDVIQPPGPMPTIPETAIKKKVLLGAVDLPGPTKPWSDARFASVSGLPSAAIEIAQSNIPSGAGLTAADLLARKII